MAAIFLQTHALTDHVPMEVSAQELITVLRSISVLVSLGSVEWIVQLVSLPKYCYLVFNDVQITFGIFSSNLTGY